MIYLGFWQCKEIVDCFPSMIARHTKTHTKARVHTHRVHTLNARTQSKSTSFHFQGVVERLDLFLVILFLNRRTRDKEEDPLPIFHIFYIKKWHWLFYIGFIVVVVNQCSKVDLVQSRLEIMGASIMEQLESKD